MTETPEIYFDTPVFRAAQWAFRNTYGTESDCLLAAVEAAAPHIAAAERERIRQLAIAEAGRFRAEPFSAADPIAAGALEDFADLLTEGDTT